MPETAGGPTHTWTNYENAGGTEGPTVPGQATMSLVCKLPGFAVADGNTWWYKIGSSPWDGQYYASADAFYNNGQTSGSLQGTPYYDPNVPDCGSAAPPPPPPAPTVHLDPGPAADGPDHWVRANGTEFRPAQPQWPGKRRPRRPTPDHQPADQWASSHRSAAQRRRRRPRAEAVVARSAPS